MARPNDHDMINTYRIRVRGHLDQRWSDWFEGFELEYHDKDTILTGMIVDQSALHGVLAKIRDLGLAIFLVERLNEEDINDEVT